MSLESNQDHSKVCQTVSLYERHLRNGASTYFYEHEFIEIIAHYEESDRMEDALLALDIALQYHNFTIDFYILKSSLLLELFKPYEALDCIDKGKAMGYEQADLFMLEAESYMLLNDKEKAIEAVNQAKTIEFGEGLAEVYFCEALIFEHFQLYNDCFESLRRSLLKDSTYGPALNKIWWCTEMSERYEESCSLHLELIDRQPYNSRAWFNLGHAYACLEMNKKSINAFEYAFIINPKFEFAYRDCAEIFLKEDLFYKALECYSEALEFIAPDSDILSKCGYCHTRLEDYRLANDFYIKAIALNPENDSALFGLAANHYHLEEYTSASSVLQKAILLDSTREEYLLLEAAIAVESDDQEKADISFQQAIELAPENELCWIKFFYYCILKSSFHKALEIIEEAEYYHHSKEIATAKIIALFAVGKNKEAQVCLYKALENNSFDKNMFYALKPENMPDHFEMIFK